MMIFLEEVEGNMGMVGVEEEHEICCVSFCVDMGDMCGACW